MGWDADDGHEENGDPVLTPCGIDLDRFELLVEQNNCGETEYPEE